MSKSPQHLLLQLRSLREQLSRRDLGVATTSVARAEDALGARTGALAASTLPEHTDPARFAAAVATRSALASLVSTQRTQLDVARNELAVATQAWLSAEREREAADRLVESERERARDEVDSAAQREADDLAVTRHRTDDGGRR